jgi:hypothetical protein
MLWDINEMAYFVRALRLLRGNLNPMNLTAKLTKTTKGKFNPICRRIYALVYLACPLRCMRFIILPQHMGRYA